MTQAIASYGRFNGRTGEATALAVGNVDGCDYCRAAHTLSAIRAGFEQNQTIGNTAGGIDFDDTLAALLAMAREVAGEVGDVSDANRKCALAAGWSEHELVEAFGHLDANLFTDDFNHYARPELDVPAASAASR